jgi:hypothetical protein
MTQPKKTEALKAKNADRLVQTSFRVPRSLHRRVVVKCAQLDVKLGDVLVERLRMFVSEDATA